MQREEVKKLEGGMANAVRNAMTAMQVNMLIQQTIQQNLPDISVGAANLGGHIRFCSADDYQAAYRRNCTESAQRAGTPEGVCDSSSTDANAFVDIHGVAWIHEDRGDLGTAIHESLHVYSNAAWKASFGHGAEEGATELFTLQVVRASNLKLKRNFYPGEVAAVSALVDRIGLNAVGAYYFNGDSSGLDGLSEGDRAAVMNWGQMMREENHAAAVAAVKG